MAFKLPLSKLQLILTLLATSLLILILVPIWFATTHLYWGQALEPANFTYPALVTSSCPFGDRPGPTGASREHSAQGFGYTVKTPANYDPRWPHPLLVVFSPSGLGSALTERFVGLTRLATQRGFIIAYVDSKPLSLKTIQEMGTIPASIARRWCVDTQRVYFTGHSDGGTLSSALVFLDKAKLAPAAIAPSAAGVRQEDLQRYQCPRPLSVMILHNRSDHLFPGYGRSAVQWWSNCNHCDTEPTMLANGCQAYQNCRNGVTTLYCERTGSHLRWPAMNEEMLDFFSQAGVASHR
jgi:polyhydroxybutyrate depolymerase